MTAMIAKSIYSKLTHRLKSGVVARALSPLCILLALLLLSIGGRAAIAQDTTGTILGNVTDPTGASAPKAEVTITNTQTNITVVVTTSESGAYTVPQLIPGIYSVSIKMPGFETAVVRSLTLEAGDRRRTDVTLAVGATSETIEISTTAPVLQTTRVLPVLQVLGVIPASPSAKKFK